MFTPYYILAISFGAFAVIVSVLGSKKPQTFPGDFYIPMLLIAAVIGVATIAMVWRGGEKEQEHRAQEAAQQGEAPAASAHPLPVGVARNGS
jgi:uncharacterized membrane protein SpoIIM required for sporulation